MFIKVELEDLLKIPNDIIIPAAINFTEATSMQKFFEGNIEWSLTNAVEVGVNSVYDFFLEDDKYKTKNTITTLIKNPQSLFVAFATKAVQPIRDISQHQIGQHFVSKFTVNSFEDHIQGHTDMFLKDLNNRMLEYDYDIRNYANPSQNLIGMSSIPNSILYESAVLGVAIGAVLVKKIIPSIKKLFTKRDEPTISVISEYIRPIRLSMKKLSKTFKNKREKKTSRKTLKK